MGLPRHTREMTWRCVAIELLDALFFCKIVARWVYLYTRRVQVECFLLASKKHETCAHQLYTRVRWHGDALLYIGLDALRGDMQLKRNTTCEKRWKKMQQPRFRTKINYSQSRFTAFTWGLKSGLCSTFHLKNLWERVTLKWFKWNVLKTPDLSNDVYAVNRDWLQLILVRNRCCCIFPAFFACCIEF
jgi:hypothetical protein